MEFGVVIVTYNRKKLLSQCLDCVRNQTLPFTQILVVNNHSTDGSEEYLNDLAKQEPRLKAFHMKENLGGAGGFAFGFEKMSHTSCDWFLIIDDDAMIEASYMEKLADAIKDTPYLACSGTVMTNGQIDGLHRRRVKNSCLMLLEPVSTKEYQNAVFEYDISTFCGLCINTSLARTIGLPRADYFIWFDDTEYCLRFRTYSRILNVNHAILDHQTTAPQIVPVCWKHYYGFRNSIDIGRRYSSHPLIYSVYIWLNHMAHILIDTCFLLLGNKKEERVYRRQIYIDVLKGFWKGTLGKDSRYLPGISSQ